MKVVVYDNIQKKKLIDTDEVPQLSSQDALIKTLDLMDLYAKLKSSTRNTKDTIRWINLPITSKPSHAG